MLDRLRKILETKETRNRIEKLERQLEAIDQEAYSNSEEIQRLHEETERNRNSIAEIQSELDGSEHSPAEWTEAETQVMAILFDSEKYLTNSQIGQKLEEKKSGDKIRPIIHRIKKKIELLEKKKGRAKAYKLPQSIKQEYLEKGKIENQ